MSTAIKSSCGSVLVCHYVCGCCNNNASCNWQWSAAQCCVTTPRVWMAPSVNQQAPMTSSACARSEQSATVVRQVSNGLFSLHLCIHQCIKLCRSLVSVETISWSLLCILITSWATDLYIRCPLYVVERQWTYKADNSLAFEMQCFRNYTLSSWVCYVVQLVRLCCQQLARSSQDLKFDHFICYLSILQDVADETRRQVEALVSVVFLLFYVCLGLSVYWHLSV